MVAKIKKPPKIDLTDKAVKYFIAKSKGNTKQEALKIAGYSENSHQTSSIESSKKYGQIQEYFKDHLLKQIGLEDISKELKKNIVQDQDKGAKNTAIKLALDKLEPNESLRDDEDRVLVVLRPIKTIEATKEDSLEGEFISEDD